MPTTELSDPIFAPIDRPVVPDLVKRDDGEKMKKAKHVENQVSASEMGNARFLFFFSASVFVWIPSN